MHNDNDDNTFDIQRRKALKRMAALSSLAAIPVLAMPGRAHAAKAPKAAMQYQDHPKKGQRCDECIHWIPGETADSVGKCAVVQGDIQPQGWCIAYVAKK